MSNVGTVRSSQAGDWREGWRLRAWGLPEDGWRQCEIAEALGGTEGAVSQWLQRARSLRGGSRAEGTPDEDLEPLLVV